MSGAVAPRIGPRLVGVAALAVALLGPRRWLRLHTAGLWWLWLIFVLTELPAAPDGRLAAAAASAALLAAAGVRIATTRRVTRQWAMASPISGQ